MKWIACTVLIFVSASASATDRKHSRPNDSLSDTFDPTTVRQLSPEDELIGMAQIGKSVRLPFDFSVTSKGNGVLKIGGTGIRTYDAHGDGLIFEGFLLRHKLVDVNLDGYKDLVVFGIAIITPDGRDLPVSRQPLTSIFLYRPKTGTLINTVPDDAVHTYQLGRHDRRRLRPITVDAQKGRASRRPAGRK